MQWCGAPISMHKHTLLLSRKCFQRLCPPSNSAKLKKSWETILVLQVTEDDNGSEDKIHDERAEFLVCPATSWVAV